MGGRLIDYFMVCGLGPDVKTLQEERGLRGLHNAYQAALLDQYPAVSPDGAAPPPELARCVLPGGLEFHTQGPSASDSLTLARSYPIVLTDGDGSKLYVSCVAFRDPVDADIAEAYLIPKGIYADKCICILSRWPFFQVFRETLEEIHRLCFTAAGSSKPIWDTITHLVDCVPLPHPGRSQVLFTIDNCLLHVQSPAEAGLPYADISFQPLIQCLDVNNVIRLFTVLLLEKRTLLRASKYTLLTLVAEAILHLLYPIKWQGVYIPVLPYVGVDFIDAPTLYFFGLHSSLDISNLSLEGVTVVDLDFNHMYIADDTPPLPEPELSNLRSAVHTLVHPTLVTLDRSKKLVKPRYDREAIQLAKPWGKQHDNKLRLIFLELFASLMNGYRDFVLETLFTMFGSQDPTQSGANIFNADAFVRKRSRMTNQPVDPLVAQFIRSQGFIHFLESGLGSAKEGANLVDAVIDAQQQEKDYSYLAQPPAGGSDILAVLEPLPSTTEQMAGKRGMRYTYTAFPALERSAEQEQARKDMLARAIEDRERPADMPPHQPPVDDEVKAIPKEPRKIDVQRGHAETNQMVLDIKVKLQGLWRRLLELDPAEEDPTSSPQYGTISALIDSDAEGMTAIGFVECIIEHMKHGWDCQLSTEHFAAVKELLILTLSSAAERGDVSTAQAVMEISSRIFRRDLGNVKDYMARHLCSLPTWDDPEYWSEYFDLLLEHVVMQEGNHAVMVLEQLMLVACHMAELGLLEQEAWAILESLALKNGLGYTHMLKLRGVLARVRQVSHAYWGHPSAAVPGMSPRLLEGQDSLGGVVRMHGSLDDGVGSDGRKGWSLFSKMKEREGQANGGSPSDERRKPVLLDSNYDLQDKTKGSPAGPAGGAPSPKVDVRSGPGGVRRGPSGVRLLRGHKDAVTALHAGTRAELGDLVSQTDDVGYLVSGSADATVKLWHPDSRGSELRATLEGHQAAVRCISSDRGRIVTGSDDHRVLVWDKITAQLAVELRGHEGSVGCVRLLPGQRVLTAGWDGMVKMWDVRSDQCVATVARAACPVLCFDYVDHAGMLAFGGTDGTLNLWDIREGKQRYKLVGHTNWIRAIRMHGDTIVTGSDDWTARVWELSGGQCEAVLTCHGGPITCVDYCISSQGVVTGSADCTVRLWERVEGLLQSVTTIGLHGGPIVAVRSGDRWLGIGAQDNSMSLHRQPEGAGPGVDAASMWNQGWGHRRRSMRDWQLHRTLNRSAAVVRHVAVDVDRGRLCSGGRNGILRLWEPP
eukprot:SM000004S15064  [mRNA]  locus=s4:1016752:1026454:- [translate_table: standard]